MSRQKNKKQKKQRPKRGFNIVTSGQFRTLAMFFCKSFGDLLYRNSLFINGIFLWPGWSHTIQSILDQMCWMMSPEHGFPLAVSAFNKWSSMLMLCYWLQQELFTTFQDLRVQLEHVCICWSTVLRFHHFLATLVALQFTPVSRWVVVSD